MSFIIQEFASSQYIKSSIFKDKLPLSKERVNAKVFHRKTTAIRFITLMQAKVNNSFYLHNIDNNESFLIIK